MMKRLLLFFNYFGNLNDVSSSSSSSSSSSFSSAPTTTSRPLETNKNRNTMKNVRGGYTSLSSSSAVVEDYIYADLPPTVFSPSGRLVAVEQILPLLTNVRDRSSCLVIAIRCRDELGGATSTVVVASLPKSPYLYDPQNATNVTAVPEALWIIDDQKNVKNKHKTRGNSAGVVPPPTSLPPPFCRLAPRLFGVSAGNAADAQILRHQLHELALALRQEGGGSTNNGSMARWLARRWADLVHQRTLQESDARLLACSALLVEGEEIWRVEPTGQLYRCRAAVVGRGASKAEQLLLDLLQDQINEKKKGGDADDDKDVIKNKEDTTTNSSTSSSSPCPSGKNHDQDQLKSALMNLTIKEALALATKTIVATLQDDSDSEDVAVRIRGLSIPSSTDATVQWYNQESLVQQ